MDWLGRADLLSAARQLYRWSLESEKPDSRRDLGYQERDRARARAGLEELQAHLHLASDREVFVHFLGAVVALPEAERPAELMAWLRAVAPAAGDDAARVEAAAARLYTSPALADAATRVDWFGKPSSALRASTDPWITLAVALRPYDEAREARGKAQRGLELRTRPAFAEGLAGAEPDRAYSDANGTLRVTFGTVQGYRPRDGTVSLPQTTVAGIVEKAGDWPFAAPEALTAAIARGAWGPYADPALGTVPVDFLSDLDITGGNSGSPILDAKGRMVGLAFDGTYEGIVSDWRFDPALARTVGVDVRYLLWYLDAVAGADTLLAEMGITGTI